MDSKNSNCIDIPDVLWKIICDYAYTTLYEVEAEMDINYRDKLTIIDDQNIFLVNTGSEINVYDLKTRILRNNYLYEKNPNWLSSFLHHYKICTFYNKSHLYSYIETRKNYGNFLYDINLCDGSTTKIDLDDKDLYNYYKGTLNDDNKIIDIIELHDDILYIYYDARDHLEFLQKINMKSHESCGDIDWPSRWICCKESIKNNKIHFIKNIPTGIEIETWNIKDVVFDNKIYIKMYTDKVCQDILKKLNSYSLGEKYYKHIIFQNYDNIYIVDNILQIIYKIDDSVLCLLLNINSGEFVDLIYISIPNKYMYYAKCYININKKYILCGGILLFLKEKVNII
jgi:hypothetical protein